jgi:hypothetical protein
MITNDKTRHAFTAVLDEAGAKTCVSCGRRAAVRAVLAVTATAVHTPVGVEGVEDAKWFCFECGHEEQVAHLVIV